MWSIAFTFNIELSKYSSHIGSLCNSSNPEFHCFICRRIDNKLLCVFIIGSGGQDAPDIRSVSKLSKCEGSKVYTLLTVNPKLIMLLSSKINNGFMIELEVNRELCTNYFIVKEQWQYHAGI